MYFLRFKAQKRQIQSTFFASPSYIVLNRKYNVNYMLMKEVRAQTWQPQRISFVLKACEIQPAVHSVHWTLGLSVCIGHQRASQA